MQRLEECLGLLPDGTLEVEDGAAGMATAEDSDTDIEDIESTFEPFHDLMKRRFLWYYDSYLLTIAEAEKGVKVQEEFKRMPFEGSGNVMSGKFNYPELRRRLQQIRRRLDKETNDWAIQGLAAMKKETSLASNLQRKVEQILESYKNNHTVSLDIELEDRNPFVWNLTIFGRPMTHLDGGMFRIKICISPRFPDEQPRVIFQTRMFHHRIAKDGVMCYFPTKPEDMKSHISAIIEALEEESPPYDPRTMVNPEAAKLFWGSAEDKRNYNRQLRRSVQRSME